MPTIIESARWEAASMDGIVIVTEMDPNPEDADKPWDGAQVAWRRMDERARVGAKLWVR